MPEVHSTDARVLIASRLFYVINPLSTVTYPFNSACPDPPCGPHNPLLPNLVFLPATCRSVAAFSAQVQFHLSVRETAPLTRCPSSQTLDFRITSTSLGSQLSIMGGPNTVGKRRKTTH